MEGYADKMASALQNEKMLLLERQLVEERERAASMQVFGPPIELMMSLIAVP